MPRLQWDLIGNTSFFVRLVSFMQTILRLELVERMNVVDCLFAYFNEVVVANDSKRPTFEREV